MNLMSTTIVMNQKTILLMTEITSCTGQETFASLESNFLALTDLGFDVGLLRQQEHNLLKRIILNNLIQQHPNKPQIQLPHLLPQISHNPISLLFPYHLLRQYWIYLSINNITK